MEEIESPETSVRRRLLPDYVGGATAFAEARQQAHQPEGDVSDGSNLTGDPQATSLFLSRVTDTLVMGLVTLTSLTATYLLAWGKPGTNCIPNFNTTVTNDTTTSNSSINDGKDSKYPDASWHQIISAILPFVIFPISLYFSGLAKIAETDKRPISCVATICVFEFLLVIALGAEMAYCMMGVPFYDVLAVIIPLTFVMLVVWSFTFKYPKLLPIHRKWSEDGP